MSIRFLNVDFPNLDYSIWPKTMHVDENQQTDGESSDSVEYPSDDETSAYERRVLKMKRRRVRAFFSEFKDGDIVKASDLLPDSTPPTSPIKKKAYKKRKSYSTPTAVLQPRKSTRLSSKSVDYHGLDDDFHEPPIYRRKSVAGERRYRTPKIRLANRKVEFNPDAIPGTICYTSQKVYSHSGTTCHQCRQKTIDKKSQCYSASCRGFRGMFCGYCLLQRYGEDVAVVLQDPTWKCPPCRKICNCSICRRSYGKPPTGQLFHKATGQGYGNVLEYLSKIGDDKLEDDTDHESEGEEEFDQREGNEENEPPVQEQNIKEPRTCLKNPVPVVRLNRLNLSFDEDGNLLTDFSGF